MGCKFKAVCLLLLYISAATKEILAKREPSEGRDKTLEETITTLDYETKNNAAARSQMGIVAHLSTLKTPTTLLSAVILSSSQSSNVGLMNKSLLVAKEGLHVRLWVYPLSYDHAKCRAMNYTLDPLRHCEKLGASAVFGLFVAILGAVIILGNSLIPLIVWKQQDMKTNLNYIKVSLAFVDMIAGFILLFSVLPNVIWFRNATEHDAMTEIVDSFNSPTAILSASALIFTFQGSLMHLMFLSAERFIAIKWPLWHRLRKTTTVICTLAALWLLTLMCSVVTAAFPSYYSYMYNPQVFMYTLGYNVRKDNPSSIHGLLHFGLTLFLPYLTTIILTTLTGVVAFRELKSTAIHRKYSGGNNEHSSRRTTSLLSEEADETRRSACQSTNDFEISKTIAFVRKLEKRFRLNPELTVLKTIIIMVAAFVVAWSLFFVIFFISYGEYSKPNEAMSIMYMVSFYSGLSNSVANVIIYSVWDERFRTAITTTFLPSHMCKFSWSKYKTTKPQYGDSNLRR